MATEAQNAQKLIFVVWVFLWPFFQIFGTCRYPRYILVIHQQTKENTMNFIDRVDPELRAGLEAFPPDLLDLNDIPGTRKKLAGLFGALPAPVIKGVTSKDRHVPGPAGAPDVLVRIYQPADARPPCPLFCGSTAGVMS